jgi:hypothetical protein
MGGVAFLRKWIILLAAIMLLASCSAATENDEDFAHEIRGEFLGASRLVIGAGITADYGDRVYDFTIRYSGSSDAGEITLLAPEAVAGITAEVALENLILIYDGARLDTGALTRGGLSPAGALPMLISQWQGGSIESVGRETLGGTDTVTITTAICDSVSQKTWFDAATRLPVRAEISDGGKMVVACVFNNVVIE